MSEIISKEVLQAYMDCCECSGHCSTCKAYEFCNKLQTSFDKCLIDTALHLYKQLDALPADFISSMHNGVAEQLAEANVQLEELTKVIGVREETISANIKYIKELEHANNVMRGMLQQVKEVAK